MERINKIVAGDIKAINEAKNKWDSIAKPLHSLGLLEDAVSQIAGILGSSDVHLGKKCVIAMCGDNGVLEEGVAQSEHDVTSIVAGTMAAGSSNVNLMGEACGADVFTVDVGMINEVKEPNLINNKIAPGTKNFTKGPAMTREEAKKAISIGIDMVEMAVKKGYGTIVTGEMGIGNTTTSSAVATILLGTDVETVTGPGAGLDRAGLNRKIDAIKRGIEINKPNKEDPIDILSKLGGFDIAGMVGLYLGGGIYRVPVIVDGFISSVAAALAIKIKPEVSDYILASHVSDEPAGGLMLEYLGKRAMIQGKLCLGEGTGGVLILPMLEAALKVYHSVHTFEENNIEQYEDYNL